MKTDPERPHGLQGLLDRAFFLSIAPLARAHGLFALAVVPFTFTMDALVPDIARGLDDHGIAHGGGPLDLLEGHQLLVAAMGADGIIVEDQVAVVERHPDGAVLDSGGARPEHLSHVLVGAHALFGQCMGRGLLFSHRGRVFVLLV